LSKPERPAYIAHADWMDSFDEKVAIKVHWTEAPGVNPSRRFSAETSALASFDHHGICRLYDVISLGTEAYCAILEWIDGENIRSFCDRLRMPVKDRVQLMLPVLEALQHVHAAGFLHGDVKADHVLTTQQLKTKLIDFGSARKLATDRSESASVLDFTPEYASPELLRGENLDNRSDIYSFGVLMYDVLIGRHPYGISSRLLTNIADVVFNEEPRPPSSVLDAPNHGLKDGHSQRDAEEALAQDRSVSAARLRAIFSTDLSFIMLRAVQKARDDRYQTASDLAQDLRLWLSNRPTVAGAYREKMLPPEAPISSAIKVFLCHCSEDKPQVRELSRQLRAIGVTTWLDEDDLLPGQEWREEIPKAVAGADVVIVCLSDHSLTKKGYVQKEIGFALDVADEVPPGRIFIIPVRLVDCDVPDRLNKWQWVNLFEDRGFGRLAKALRFHSERCRTSAP